MSKFDRTQPVAGSSLDSAPVRLNMQAIEEALLGASGKAESTPAMTVRVEAFVYIGSDGTTRKSFAGGSSPALTAPSVNPRIALLTIDDAAALAWTYGAEAASPTAPNYPPSKVPICEVYSRVAMTSIRDADDNTNGFIQRQASHLWAPTAVAHGQARLTKSGANLLLSPYNGNKLMINSRVEVVPDAGVTLAPGAAVSGTTYYIYAFMSSGTMTLEFSATAYAVQVATGVYIKTADATRTLVGLARAIAGPNWADSATQIFVLSWFNRARKAGKSTYTTDPTTASASYVELGTAIRVEYLTWADEAVAHGITGKFLCGTTTVDADLAIGIDGTTAEDGSWAGGRNNDGLTRFPFAIAYEKSGLAEGYHYSTLLGRISGGATLTVYGAGGSGLRTGQTVRVQG